MRAYRHFAPILISVGFAVAVAPAASGALETEGEFSRLLIQTLLERQRDGEAVVWTDPDGATRYRLNLIDSFTTRNGDFCRAFTVSVQARQHYSHAYRTACRAHSGAWRVMFGQ